MCDPAFNQIEGVQSIKQKLICSMCVSDRDIEIQQLESMLSLLLIGRCGENKRRCMKLTHEMAIKATSVMSEASSHVNFLLSLPDLPVMNHDRTAPAPGNRQGGPLF